MLTKPQIQRLKQMTDGLEVGRVLGERVLVKLVTPYTDMTRVQKEGLLFIPETAEEANTPLPTTGIVVAVGRLTCHFCGGPWHDDQEKGAINIAHDYMGTIGEGDMLLFSKYAGTDVYLNEEAFRIMDVKEVLCTLVEREAGVGAVIPINNDPLPAA